MKLIDNIPVWGPADEASLKQIQTCYYIFGKAAMMADHHKGYGVPIGGVIAHENLISPSGVGFDIGCGNKAVLTDMPGSEARANIKAIMDDLWNSISFGVGRKNEDKSVKDAVDMFLTQTDGHEGWKIQHGVVDSKTAWKLKDLKDLACSQLGTVGSGNHFVDILVDEKDRVWIGVHFGSRGFGHKIATHFLKRAGGKDDMDSAPVVLDSRTQEGQDYIAAMQLAGEYAYAGRDWVCDRVTRMLGAKVLDSVHNHHNFAWREKHAGTDLWVVRKGATPAFPYQRGFIGGSMGDISVIVEGVENELADHSLYSTVHGAGRVLGRREAKGRKDRSTGEWVREPKVRGEEMLRWIQEKGVELRGAGVDEAPQCYKRLPDVLKEHEGTIRVLHTLQPIGVAMAGAEEFDPYKD